MKKLLLILILGTFLSSCGENRKQTITGKWKLSFNLDNHIKTLEPVEREAVKAMKVADLEAMVADLQKELNNTKYIFDKEGKYEVYYNGEKKQEGTWQLSQKQDTLYAIASDKQKYSYFIQECSPSALNLKGKNSKDAIYLTPMKK